MSHNDINHVLGKKTEYKFTYDPEVLAREPRVRNRLSYGFDNDTVPWKVGFDAWHEYEASFLTEKGLPVNGILKIIVPADSEFIVESKSLKLYLFSLNMVRLPGLKKDAIKKYKEIVETDLSALLEAPIITEFFTESQANFVADKHLKNAESLDRLVDLDSIEFNNFTENPDILQAGESFAVRTILIKSDLLRSRCKITSQPDSGTIFIKMKGSSIPTIDSLAQYLVSMRNENHFHEEIVECVYSRLTTKFQPEELMVAALYTRRGGIDICPMRASSQELIPPQLSDVNCLTIKEYRS